MSDGKIDGKIKELVAAQVDALLAVVSEYRNEIENPVPDYSYRQMLRQRVFRAHDQLKATLSEHPE